MAGRVAHLSADHGGDVLTPFPDHSRADGVLRARRPWLKEAGASPTWVDGWHLRRFLGHPRPIRGAGPETPFQVTTWKGVFYLVEMGADDRNRTRNLLFTKWRRGVHRYVSKFVAYLVG